MTDNLPPSAMDNYETIPARPLLGRKDIFLLLTAFIFIYTQLFQLPFTPIYFDGDSLISVSNAIRMLDGQTIYRDFFDFTPPGTELVYLVLFKIFGVKVWILNATIVSLGLVLTSLIHFFSRRILAGASVYLPASIFLVIGYRQFGIDGSNRLFSVIFVLIAVAVLFDRRTLTRIMFAGCLCGLSSFFVQTRGVLGIGAIAVYVVWENYRYGFNFRLLLKNALSLAASFVLTIIVTQSYFLWHAGFDTYYFSLIDFPLKYYPYLSLNRYSAYLFELRNPDVNANVFSSISSFSQYFRDTIPVLFYYLLIPLVYFVFAFYCWWRKKPLEFIDIYPKLILLWLLGIFLAIGVSAPTALRLYQVAIPGLVIMVWLILQSRILKSVVPFVLVLLVMIAVLYSLQRQLIHKSSLDMPGGNAAFLSEHNFDKYAWIKSHIQPGEVIYEANHPDFYFPFHLKNPTPMYSIRDSGYTPDYQVAAILRALEMQRPRIIIWPENWSRPAQMRAPDDNLAPIWQFISTNYERKFVFTGSGSSSVLGEGDGEIWEIKP